MNTFSRIICITAICLATTLSACATNTTAKKLPFIPGTDTSKVNMFIENDTGTVILSGQVKRNFDKINIEKHLREELGYEKISNQITTTN